MSDRVQVLSYAYPCTVRVMIGNHVYTYVSSHFHIRKFMQTVSYGKGFEAFNRFKQSANLTKKEVI